uniref:glutathione synthase n=1 Tax=Globodera rostochiensis TaxID=31243 RepID=A0A914H118_GLORO
MGQEQQKINFSNILPSSQNNSSSSSSSFFSGYRINMMLSASAAGSILGSVPVTNLIAKIGLRNTAIVYTIISIFSGAIFPVSVQFMGFIPSLIVRLLQGTSFPLQMILIGSVSKEWIPAASTGSHLLLLSMHYQLGPLVSMAAAGQFCASRWGWPALYYFQSVVTFIILALFWQFYTEMPENNHSTTSTELALIRKCNDGEGLAKSAKVSDKKTLGCQKVPYARILTDGLVWLVFVAFFTGELGMQTFVLYGPTFLNKTSISASITFLVALVVKSLASPLNTFISSFMSESQRVKLFVFMPQSIQICCFVSLALLPKILLSTLTIPIWLVQILYTSVVAFAGLDFLGVVRCAQMISQSFSHILMNWISAINSLILLLLPIFVTFAVPNQNVEEWARVFVGIAILLVFSMAIFLLFGNSLPRRWTKAEVAEEKRKRPAKDCVQPVEMSIVIDSTEITSMRNYPENLVQSEKELHELAQFTIEWAHNNGLILRASKYYHTSDIAQFAPISLFPSPFPHQAFDQIVAVHTAMQLLYFRVGNDLDFLLNAYNDVIETDEHIRAMVNIVREAHEEGIKQPITLLIMRADYMMNSLKNSENDSEQQQQQQQLEVKQVEVNTGAIVALGIDHRTTELHRQVLKKFGLNTSNSPDNVGDTNLAESMFMAWKAFGNSKALMVFLTIPNFLYKFDLHQLACELKRLSKDQMDIEYVSLKGGQTQLKLGDDFSLLLNGKIVGVIYSCISALGYVITAESMEVRRTIERSTAIKAPSLAHAISSSKKVQQLLAMPGTVERFFPDPADADKVAAIRETFAGLWGLENNDDKTERLIEDAIEHPEKYVLKPNRECGGNNFYDEKLADKLRDLPQNERASYILMQKLYPTTFKNYFLRPFNEPKLSTVVGEMGIYGTLIGNKLDGSVQHNVQSGHLLRTKLAGVNEGGISVGTGVGDSPYLF